MKIGQKVKVADPMGGGNHYGKIEDIVRDMFDGGNLFLVNVKGEVKTYRAESLKELNKR